MQHHRGFVKSWKSQGLAEACIWKRKSKSKWQIILLYCGQTSYFHWDWLQHKSKLIRIKVWWMRHTHLPLAGFENLSCSTDNKGEQQIFFTFFIYKYWLTITRIVIITWFFQFDRSKPLSWFRYWIGNLVSNFSNEAVSFYMFCVKKKKSVTYFFLYPMLPWSLTSWVFIRPIDSPTQHKKARYKMMTMIVRYELQSTLIVLHGLSKHILLETQSYKY